MSTRTEYETLAREILEHDRRYYVDNAPVVADVEYDRMRKRLEQTGKDRVRVSGANGGPPTASYKVSATYADGYRVAVTMMIVGREAVAKASEAIDSGRSLSVLQQLQKKFGKE